MCEHTFITNIYRYEDFTLIENANQNHAEQKRILSFFESTSQREGVTLRLALHTHKISVHGVSRYILHRITD